MNELYEILTKVRHLRAKTYETGCFHMDAIGPDVYQQIKGSIGAYDEVIQLLTTEIGRLQVAAS